MRSTTRSLAGRAGAVARRVAGKKTSANVRSGGAKKAPAKNAAKNAAKKAAKKPVTKAAAKKTVAKKTVAKKTAPAKKAAVKRAAPAKKSVAKKAPAKKAPVKKAPVKKAAAKKAAPVKKTAPVKKAAPVKKTVAKKAAPAKKAATKAPANTATKTKAKTAATPAPAKKAAPAARRRRPATPGSLVVLASEKPWTKNQLDGVKAHLLEDIKRLVPELEIADEDLHKLMVDAGDGAGNDQADVGSTTFERDHEMTIANNARDMLVQSRHALERIDDGSYGICESCGEPIGKMRLLAFPRATLCMACKQREERR